MEWRPIPEWPNYEVSDQGEVRRAVAIRNSAKHSLVKSFLRSGYPTVSLCYGAGSQKARKYLIHQLVAEAFLGPKPSDEHVVAHGDGNKQNNRLVNLRWATRAENEADKKIHRTNPKLTVELVREIRSTWINVPTRKLGRMLNVDPSYLSKVKRGLVWA